MREHPPYTAEYEKRYGGARIALRDADRYPDVQTNCGVPVGFPRIMNLPDAMEFIVRPDEFYIIAENGGNTMRVYTDGRKLPGKEDTWGTYTGVSVGHWEGDTLVWETIGLKGFRDKDSILDQNRPGAGATKRRSPPGCTRSTTTRSRPRWSLRIRKL